MSDSYFFLAADDVGKILGCSANHARCLMESGRIESVDIGSGRRKMWRTSRANVMAFVEGGNAVHRTEQRKKSRRKNRKLPEVESFI